MVLKRIIRQVDPKALAKTIAQAIVLPFGISVLYLTLLGLILRVDPAPVVIGFLVDGSYASAPIVACCVLAWLAYLPVHATVVYPRSTQILASLRDECIYPTKAPKWFPVPCYTEKWRFLIHRAHVAWCRLKRTVENADGTLSTFWSASLNPQLE